MLKCWKRQILLTEKEANDGDFEPENAERGRNGITDHKTTDIGANAEMQKAEERNQGWRGWREWGREGRKITRRMARCAGNMTDGHTTWAMWHRAT
jgi:hypothetical protein